jgi:hypothetical protein
MMKNLSLLLAIICTAFIHYEANGQTDSCGCAVVYVDKVVEIEDNNCNFLADYPQVDENRAQILVNGEPVLVITEKSIPTGAKRYCYGPGLNQWFDLYRATDSNNNVITTNAPIYVWSHPNGGQADMLLVKNNIWNPKLKKREIHLLSWASVPKLVSGNTDQLHQAYLDLEAIINAIENEDIPKPGSTTEMVENIDNSKIFIGGQSRGTVVSWRYAQRFGNKIRGIYFTQAFPNGSWAALRPQDWVNSKSPNLFMAYEKQIYTTDGHDPANGEVVFDAYFSADLKARLEHSLGESTSNPLYSKLKAFIKDENGSIPSALRVVYDAGVTITTGTDTKDAACPDPHPGGTGDVMCKDALSQSGCENPVITDLDYTAQDHKINMTWSGPSSCVDSPTLNQCLFRAFEPDDPNTLLVLEIADLTSAVIPFPNKIEASNLEVINWTLSPKFVDEGSGTLVAFQVKCILDGQETEWSAGEIITVGTDYPPTGNSVSDQLNENYLDVTPNSEYAMITSNTSGVFQVRIFNTLGQLMSSEEIFLNDGANYYNHQTKLSSGMYIFTVDGAGLKDSEVFLVQ